MGRTRLRLKSNIKKRMIRLIALACIIVQSGSTFIDPENDWLDNDEIIPTISEQNGESASNENNGEDAQIIKSKLNQYSIDVLAIGNSSLYSAFNPLQLWHEKGITSFSAAGPKQNMAVSYMILKKALKIRQPKLIILEVTNFFETRGTDDNSENNKLATEYMYPLYKGTSYWKELANKSYVRRNTFNNHMKFKGYYYNNKVKGYFLGDSYMKMSDQKAKVSQYTQKYLSQIVELANQNNCKILFMCSPCAYSWTYPKHNTVVEIAKEYNIPFIDFNVGKLITHFNWETDSRDGGNHLNYSGAEKLTKYMGDYLGSNYNFEDYRNNGLFLDWDNEYNAFMKRIS